MSELTAGESTCPVCSMTWTVTPARDCLMPSCGCFGDDFSAANPARPCESCGVSHALRCDKMPGPDDPRTEAAKQELVDMGIARWVDGQAVVGGEITDGKGRG